MKKECIAMLLAGGQGSRLYVLTENMAKPAVPFGGKFRIIDFPLSNCANSRATWICRPLRWLTQCAVATLRWLAATWGTWPN